MYKLASIALSASIIALSGCNSTPKNVAFDPSINYSAVTTFSWDKKINSSQEDIEIRNTLMNELKRKGITESKGTVGDVIISYGSFEKKAKKSKSSYSHSGDNSAAVFNMAYESAPQSSILGRTVFFGVNMKAPSGKSVWQGINKINFDEKTNKSRKLNKIKSVITKIIDNYPPK